MHINFSSIKRIINPSLILVLLIFLNFCTNNSSNDIQKDKEVIKTFDQFGMVVDSLIRIEAEVNMNETLSDILLEQNIEFNLITKIFQESKPIFDFTKIRPHKKYVVYLNRDSIKSLNSFVYEIDKINYIKIVNGDSLTVDKIEREVSYIQKVAEGKINSSLYLTFQELDLSPVLAGELAEVYAWQIDFYTIAKGDSFKVLFKEKFVENEFVGVGEILGAEFFHRGEKFSAYLFEQDGKREYFDEFGKSLQKEFLKAPVKFTRISSGYSNRRLHPILRVYKPHRGIDFAAPRGTPVQSVGDGIVTLRQNSGAAGRYVKVKHNSVYTSGYMHLSKYGKGISPGVRVRQGQIIGYVGSSGRSTGPHLDFRFWKNGSLVNYLRQKFPSSKSVKEKNMELFNGVVKIVDFKLE